MLCLQVQCYENQGLFIRFELASYMASQHACASVSNKRLIFYAYSFYKTIGRK